jgi:hypothetical protein
MHSRNDRDLSLEKLNMSGGDFRLSSSGGNVLARTFQSIEQTAGNIEIHSSFNGIVDLSGLTDVRNAGNNGFVVSTVFGGTVDMSSLSKFGYGSVSHVSISNGGQLLWANPNDISGISLSYSGGSLRTQQVAKADDANVSVFEGTLGFPQLKSYTTHGSTLLSFGDSLNLSNVERVRLDGRLDLQARNGVIDLRSARVDFGEQGVLGIDIRKGSVKGGSVDLSSATDLPNLFVSVDDGILKLSEQSVTVKAGVIGVFENGVIDVGQLVLRGPLTLHGNGTIDGDVTNDGGSIAPLSIPRAECCRTGELKINGTYRQQTGHISFTIEGTSSGKNVDHLVITGQADLSGSIATQVITKNYEPSIGDVVPLLTAERIQGRFTEQLFPVIDGTPLGLALIYTEKNVLGRISIRGDANFDNEFNSSDLVLIFQEGQYEDDRPGNSTWRSGDWNGDSEFDSGDLVTAFQGGVYESGPPVLLVASIPEPNSKFLFGSAIVIAVFLRPTFICRHPAAADAWQILILRWRSTCTVVPCLADSRNKNRL